MNEMRCRERACRGSRGAAGFSLLELFAVVAIIAVLAVIAVPRFSNSVALSRVEQAARRIANDLALAQRRARTTSTSQKVMFHTDNDWYSLIGVAHLDHSESEYLVDLSKEPYCAVLVSADFGGDNEVVFDGYGTCDSGGTVVVQVGSHLRTISVDADTAKASVQ